MKVDIITIFPEMTQLALEVGIVGRSQRSELVKITAHNLRDFSDNKHKSVDDYLYGGGAGMLLKPEPIFKAVRSLSPSLETKVVLLSPQGQKFTQKMAERLSLEKHLIFICGRYKGVDERVKTKLVTDEVSIGDYILSGGEFAALVVIDSIVRLIPGAISDFESAQYDSFEEGFLDSPHYTRPNEFEGLKVPEVLLSGDPKKIKKWQRQESIRRTFLKRPDLLKTAILSEDEINFIENLKKLERDGDAYEPHKFSRGSISEK